MRRKIEEKGMKKALSRLLLLSVFIPLLCACSGKEAPVTERFA
jgi:hypothetical protein